MNHRFSFAALSAVLVAGLTILACTDDSLMQPPAQVADIAEVAENPFAAALGSGQCMGDDAVSFPANVSGFGTDPNAFNCTANDVRIANARTTSGDPIQCVPGDDILVDIVADIVETSTSTRHDIGIWIAEDGGNAETGECSFFYFDDDDVDAFPLDPVDADGDNCGDMTNAGTVTDFDLDNLTLTCPSDPVIIGDQTFIEIASCVSWTQPGGDRVCPDDAAGDGDPPGVDDFRAGTLPANKSKCNCEPFLVEVEILAKLTLVKTVVNDDGGTAVADDFQASIAGVGDVDWDSATVLAAGNYDANETVVTGYTAGDWGGDCNADGTIALASGQNAVCTITNDDNPAFLTLNKIVVNDDGGTAVADDFQAKIDGDNVPWGVAQSVGAGSFTASEVGVTGYTASVWGGDCAEDGTVTLALGESKTCTITNDDNPAGLILNKIVINDDGGTAVADDFQAKINGDNVPWGVAQSVGAGSFTASEVGVTGYTASVWSGDCAADGTVTLALGENKTCSITNDDDPAFLTLNKIVVNDDGGTAVADDFQAKIDGNNVPWGVAQSVGAGSFTASETVVAGYTAGDWGGDCAADGSVTLALGENKTCSITNNDNPAFLTLNKIVVNDDGGTAVEADFQAKIDGGNVPWGVPQSVGAGSFTASETVVANYTAGDWTGDCNPDGTVTLALGDNKSCTITNDDDPAHLTLVKEVINDDGGGAVATDWTLFAAGPTPISGAGGADSDVSAGTYTLSESAGPPFYTAGNWVCVGGTQVGDQVTLDNGESATCTIINDDVAVCGPGDRLTSVSLEVTALSSSPMDIAWTDDNGNLESALFTPVDGSPSTVGEVFTIEPLVGDFFESQNLRFSLNGVPSKNLKVHLSCSDDPAIGDVHFGDANGNSAELTKTAFETTTF
jgi:hypothetical protein